MIVIIRGQYVVHSYRGFVLDMLCKILFLNSYCTVSVVLAQFFFGFSNFS